MWHWYHVYAAGNWMAPVIEHCRALTEYGLFDELDGMFVGFVGADDEIDAVRSTLDVLVPGWTECARAAQGWEQVTLDAMYEFVQDHDGLVSYAHTKGASRNEGIDLQWRRGMEYHNFVQWKRPVEALAIGGRSIAGCYWVSGAPSSIPGYGTGGMFGGNYWWTRAELLRQNVPPGHESRFAAEHWLGQLSEVMPITVGGTIEELCPSVIWAPSPEW